jgi:hypothetical protein
VDLIHRPQRLLPSHSFELTNQFLPLLHQVLVISLLDPIEPLKLPIHIVNHPHQLHILPTEHSSQPMHSRICPAKYLRVLTHQNLWKQSVNSCHLKWVQANAHTYHHILKTQHIAHLVVILYPRQTTALPVNWLVITCRILQKSILCSNQILTDKLKINSCPSMIAMASLNFSKSLFWISFFSRIFIEQKRTSLTSLKKQSSKNRILCSWQTFFLNSLNPTLYSECSSVPGKKWRSYA